MGLNLTLFEQIKAALRAEPRRLYMETWATVAGDQEFDTLADKPPCGAAACLAGHAVWIVDGQGALAQMVMDDSGDFAERARELLGIEGPCPLFTHDSWPDDLAELYETGHGSDAAVEAACLAIDSFIAWYESSEGKRHREDDLGWGESGPSWRAHDRANREPYSLEE